MTSIPHGYLQGINHGAASEREDHRIAVFGAIRRAAEVARDCDRMGDKCVPYSVTHYDYVQRASEVRAAIRAAIGSEKTS